MTVTKKNANFGKNGVVPPLCLSVLVAGHLSRRLVMTRGAFNLCLWVLVAGHLSWRLLMTREAFNGLSVKYVET